MANANQVIVNGETILDLRSDTVTPETLQKGYTAHDKSGTKITGTLEASSSGRAKETWIIKSSARGEFATTQIAFTSNGQKFTSIGANDSSGIAMILYYDSHEAAGYDPAGGGVYEFELEAYRKLTFDTPPTGALLKWLQANGVKQPDDTAVQDTKALTITSNGTVSVTPDAPYDALKKVDVTVDVASGGGSGETTSLQVYVDSGYIDAPIYCLWQTSNGWMGTGKFDSSTGFTLSNVIVGGYVIFTHDPLAQMYFESYSMKGVESFSVDAMAPEEDTNDAALVIKVIAPSPKFNLVLRSY